MLALYLILAATTVMALPYQSNSTYNQSAAVQNIHIKPEEDSIPTRSFIYTTDLAFTFSSQVPTVTSTEQSSSSSSQEPTTDGAAGGTRGVLTLSSAVPGQESSSIATPAPAETTVTPEPTSKTSSAPSMPVQTSTTPIMSSIMQTSAAVPPTSAAVPPTSAAIPPTSAAIPPTSAAVPPTSAAVPSSSAVQPPVSSIQASTSGAGGNPSATGPVSTIPINTKIPAPTGLAKSNPALAISENKKFAALTAGSSCTGSDTACINGAYSKCVNGVYTTVLQCLAPLSCFALPLQKTTGVNIACISAADAAGSMGISQQELMSMVPSTTGAIVPSTSAGSIPSMSSSTGAAVPPTSAGLVPSMSSSASTPPVVTSPSTSVVPSTPPAATTPPAAVTSTPAASSNTGCPLQSIATVTVTQIVAAPSGS